MIAAQTGVGVCPCVKRHAPATPYVDHHHILPQGWGGPTETGNLVAICQNCHRTVHEILEKTVRDQAWPPASFLRSLNSYAVGLAQQAVKAYGGIPPKHMAGLAYRFEPQEHKG